MQPRLHLFGRRVHECHVGLVLAAVTVLCLLRNAGDLWVAGLALLAG